jgi:hypothetical protein
MALVLMRVIGIVIETADMLVKEVLSRNSRDQRAHAFAAQRPTCALARFSSSRRHLT